VRRPAALSSFSGADAAALQPMGFAEVQGPQTGTRRSIRQQQRGKQQKGARMLIRTRMGVSVDGFIATPDGIPVFVVMPDLVPHESYGWPEFDDQIDAVVLGRVALDVGLAASTWP